MVSLGWFLCGLVRCVGLGVSFVVLCDFACFVGWRLLRVLRGLGWDAWFSWIFVVCVELV